MSWNYRIIKKEHDHLRGECEGMTETSYAIHEVYYEKDGSIKLWSKDPIAVFGETEEELKSDLEYQFRALEKPVLVEKEGKLIDAE